ncbi:hypothetical protein L0Y59_04580 [Candidatus Uhrbacteria bacterium]|nr:hypothetical protein [Candidatus Uhrbacteria bacterium]
MDIVMVFLLGLGVLVGAVALNALASALGLPNWYAFLAKPEGTTPLGYLWLFVVYPFGLGAVAYYLYRLFF